MKPVSSGRGRLKLPGHSQWLDVSLPEVKRKVTDFRRGDNRSVSTANSVRPEFIDVRDVSQSNQTVSPNALTKEQIIELLLQGVSRSRIVKDYLGYKGVNYQKGLQTLNQILDGAV